MIMPKEHLMCYYPVLNLLNCLLERSLKSFPAVLRRQYLVIIECIIKIARDLRQENQLATHPLELRTCAQNSSEDRPRSGSCSYAAHRLSNSKRCATGAGSVL